MKRGRGGTPRETFMQIMRNRRILKQTGRLEKFIKGLESTIAEEFATVEVGGKTKRLRTKREAIPTVVIFHAPEDLSQYPPEYRRHAHDKNPLRRRRIERSAWFTRAMIRHQKKHGNIVMGLFGHVEGGQDFVVNVPKGRNINFLNACNIVQNDEFPIKDMRGKDRHPLTIIGRYGISFSRDNTIEVARQGGPSKLSKYENRIPDIKTS